MEIQNCYCRELVKLLVKRFGRLKEVAKNSSLLCLASQKMGALPGLTLVGEAQDNAPASNIASEAIKCAQKQTEKNTINEIIGKHL